MKKKKNLRIKIYKYIAKNMKKNCNILIARRRKRRNELIEIHNEKLSFCLEQGEKHFDER